ncbi:MAG: four helix bundle protein [Candidatus Scalindua sp.]|nr:four helix bundle protein [Candidatus Scalindua sp.]
MHFKLRITTIKKDNIILEKSFDFALSIIELYKNMTEQKEYILSKQILRSGTSCKEMLNFRFCILN